MLHRKQTLWGFIFIAPTILGLLIFQFGPMLFSLIMSFFDWDVVTTPKLNNGANFVSLYTDPLISQALKVTFYFTALSVPIGNAFALAIASLLNSKRLKGMSVFRTIFYIPSICPAVATAVLWTFMFNPMFGFFNGLLLAMGMDTKNWIADPNMVIPCMAFMSVWNSGGAVIIYLAGLQGVPSHLYESVDVDGGNGWHKFLNITLPLLSPVVFYNVIMAMIGNMQTFTQGYLMTDGGPQNASLFYVLYLYRTAFKNSKMGYASAQAWLMFAIVMVLTGIAFLVSKYAVYYESGEA